MVEKCKTQVNTLFATLSVHQQAFSQLDHVHHVPNAWSETLYEIARRMEFEKAFTEECVTITKALEQLRTEESKRRKDFKQRMGKFLPLDKIPGLEDPLIDFELITKTFSSKLPQIDVHYIKGISL
jgi:autophagy-related protein 11